MHDNRCYVKSSHGRPERLSAPRTETTWLGPKRYAESVAVSSTAHVDFPISGLAAFLVRSSRAVSIYFRSVLDARGNLLGLGRRCKARSKRTPAICDNGFFRPRNSPAGPSPCPRSATPPPLFRRGSGAGPKRYAEPVAGSSTAHVDFPISGLAAFLVRSSRAVSTYFRSVLDAVRNLEGRWEPRKAIPELFVAICARISIHNSTIAENSCG